MMNQVFLFGVRYSTEIGFFEKLVYIWQDQKACLVLMTLPIISLVIFREKKRKYWSLYISSFVLLVIAATMGNGYLHYFTLGIPNIVLAFVIFYKNLKQKTNVWSYILFVVLGTTLLLSQFSNVSKYTKNAVNRIVNSEIDSTGIEEILEVKKKIPEEDYNKVYVMNVDSCASWYARSDLYPANKYCGWQDHYMDLVPDRHGTSFKL